MISLIRLLGFPYEHSAGRSFREMRCSYTSCLDTVLLQSQSQNEARFRDRWDVHQGISVEWKMYHAYALSKTR